MKETRDFVEKLNYSQEDVFVYGFDMLAWESDAVIVGDTVKVLLVSVAIVSVSHLIFTLNLKSTVLVTMAIAMTLVDVIGFMQFWGVPINNVSGNNLLMCAVLLVDIMTHFTITSSNPAFGTVEMVTKFGQSQRFDTVRAVVGNYLSYVPLIFASFYVFETTFKMLVLTIVFGLFHCIFFVPSLCAFVSCSGCKKEFSSSNTQEFRLK